MNHDRSRYKRPFLAWGWLALGWPLVGLLLAWLAVSAGATRNNWLLLLSFVALTTVSLLGCVWLINWLPEDFHDGRVGLLLGYLVLAALAGLLVGIFAQRPLDDLTDFAPELALRVEAAGQIETPGYKRFENGRLLPEFEGEHVETDFDANGNLTTTTYRVVPIVPNVWRSSMPITLWAVTGSQETSITDFASWSVSIQGLVVTRQLGHYGHAVENAAAMHGLQVAEQPLLLRLYEQDVEQLAEQFRRGVWIVLVITAVFGWLPLGLAIREKIG